MSGWPMVRGQTWTPRRFASSAGGMSLRIGEVGQARVLAAYAFAQASSGTLLDVLQREISGLTSTLIFLGVLIVGYRMILYRHLLAAATGAPGIEQPFAVGAAICGVLGLGNLLV